MSTPLHFPQHILPIYHPTTVAFIDDQPAWLDILSTQLPDDIAFECFHTPRNALQKINKERNVTTSSFADYRNPEYLLREGYTTDFDCFSQALSGADRFSDISVVIVDFHMPDMNGLEFCQRINNRNIRKIILTDMVNENIAMKALNDGVIDGFVRKSEKDMAGKLLPMIRAAQKEYFFRSSANVDSLKESRLQFLQDEDFIALFRSLCQKHGVAEHYVSANPNGIAMLDLEANVTFLAIFTENDLQSHYKIARDRQAPHALLSALASRQFVFWQGFSGAYTDQCNDWISALYPVQRIHENSNLFYALIDGWPGTTDPYISPYYEYLEALH